MLSTTKTFEIDTSNPVLVTGATGYIAGVLIKQLLEQGLTVHATVRDPSKTQRLQYLQDVADNTTGSLKFFAGDLLTPGSFQDAMKGCYVVFHTASPFTGAVTDPMKELVEPAVKGTENVLLTANATPSVKRVVVTSSVVAMYTDAAETSSETPLHEDIWNRTASLTHAPYNLSKTLAEQKAWTIAGSQTQWKLTTVNPGLVIGPGLKYHESSESFKVIRSLGSNDPSMAMGAPNLGLGVVDVRDVATAHIAAAFLDEADGRHLVCGHQTFIPEMGTVIAKKYAPAYPIVKSKMPDFLWPMIWLAAPYMGTGLDREFVLKNFGVGFYFDNSKSQDVLGMRYHSLEDSLQEMYQQLIDFDAVPRPKSET